ncbi:MAG: TonB-dependent receptor [Hyphomonadaceae bacterium]|nr:TonB-dependent receptor [Hyphomonadaceae bacterium]
MGNTCSGRRNARALISLLVASASVIALQANASAQAQTAVATRTYDIPSQSLSSALTEFARQSDVRILYAHDDLAGRTAPTLRGSYRTEDALRILLADTGLTARIADDGSIRLDNPNRPQRGGAHSDQDASNAGLEDAADTEVITVTGTRIHGRLPAGSNILVMGREEIDQSGNGTIAQVLAGLPQNYGGGPAEDTSGGLSFERGAPSNSGYGSGVNLRGLGADATLILVNGRRLPAGAFAAFADVSSIPATAIERVEILPDGASALYGSDAIAGVVNIVLRRDFDGAETRLRVGSVTEGSALEQRYSQVLGGTWDKARLLASYEYYARDALSAEDRDFYRQDLRPFGGGDFRNNFSNPGNIVRSGVVYPIPAGQDGTDLDPGDLPPGPRNRIDDRTFADVLPRQERHSLFVAGGLDLTSEAELFVEARWTTRDFRIAQTPANQVVRVPAANPFFVNPFPVSLAAVNVEYSFAYDLGPRVSSGEVEAYGATFGLNAELTDTWRLEVAIADYIDTVDQRIDNSINAPALTAALADPNPATAFNPFGDGSSTNPATLNAIRGFQSDAHRGEVRSLTVHADGDLFDLPAGAVKLAFGGEIRSEYFDLTRTFFLSTPQPRITVEPTLDRDVSAIFAELSVPLVSEANAVPGVRSLDLSIAGRYETYSDFGETTNPRIGMSWVPFEGLVVRSTYGTSFKAPQLRDLVENNRVVFAFGFNDPSAAGGIRPSLLLTGNNATLEPETAETFSAGFDLRPFNAQGPEFSLTWFKSHLEDRIVDPSGSALTVFSEPRYAGLIDLSPDPAYIAALFADPEFDNLGAYSPSDIEAIVDLRLQNLAVIELDGLDLALRHDFDLWGGDARLSLSATHYLHYQEAASDQAPLVSVLDTFANPVDTRIKLGAGWQGRALGAHASVNYVDDYLDDASTPNRAIDAWTTIDTQISYNFGRDDGPGAMLSLSVLNLLDEPPPFVNNALGVGYDPDNADPLGRFVAIELRKTW